jgi:GTP-binding protein EngB required for normal cell division
LAPSLELIFVLTKTDKVKRNEQNKAIYFLENETDSKNVFVVSSLKSTGIDKLRGKLLSFK